MSEDGGKGDEHALDFMVALGRLQFEIERSRRLVVDIEATMVRARSVLVSIPSEHRRRILIIEDSAQRLTRALAEPLRAAGHVVESAAAPALQLARTFDPHAVLVVDRGASDIAVLARQLRAQHAKLCMIAIGRDESRTAPPGFAGYVRIPGELERLAQLLQALPRDA